MTTAEFQRRLHDALAHYVSHQNRETLKLNGKLEVLFQDARTSRLPEAALSKAAREELAFADRRMQAIRDRQDANTTVPRLSEVLR